LPPDTASAPARQTLVDLRGWLYTVSQKNCAKLFLP